MLIKFKYVGEGEYDIHPDLNLNQVYVLLGFDNAVPAEIKGVILNGALPKVAVGLGDVNVWQLVSVETTVGATVYSV